MFLLRARSLSGLLALACACPGYVHAGNWQRVIEGKTEIVEFDKGSIAPAGSGVTAWSRVRLDRAVMDPGGTFDTIRAQNLYDCKARRFATLRRVYFNGDAQVREDSIARHRDNNVAVGSIDERLFTLACQNAAGDAAPQADAVGKAVREIHAGERPAAMHADMRTLAVDKASRQVTQVADAAPVTPAERPRLIVLPPIDKAAADQAAASSGQISEAASADSLIAPTGRAGASRPSSGTTESAAERRRRELHYANSGPSRATRNKPAEGSSATTEPQKPAVQRNIRWSYEGEGGPGNWARLRNDYATCAAGKRQSPIDIRDGIKVNLESIKFDYSPTQFRIVDDGHTLRVNVGRGMGFTLLGKRYELEEFHFHRPAEERIDGRTYDMSVHLAHRNEEGQLAYLVVLLERGGEHPLIQTLWNNLPLERNVAVTPEEPIDVNMLLPENRGYWTYMGSLTTPPCTEGVLWMVLKQPVQIAPDQVAIFSRVFRSNARPVQAANGRLVKESR